MARIILINGSTGSGKSTVSHELALKLGITRVISTDVVRQIFRSVINPNLIDYMLVSSYEKSSSSSKLAYYEQRTILCRILDQLVERFIEENIDIIIEGVHIMPELYSRHKKKGHSIYLFTLYVESISMHKERFLKRQDESQKRISNKYLNHFEEIRSIQDFIIRQASIHDNILINNENLNNTLDTIINEIAK